MQGPWTLTGKVDAPKDQLQPLQPTGAHEHSPAEEQPYKDKAKSKVAPLQPLGSLEMARRAAGRKGSLDNSPRTYKGISSRARVAPS